MAKYIFKRIFWFIPTLFFVTIISFVLLKNSSGNAVNMLINTSSSNGSNNIEIQKKYWENKLGLNLPLFYFSVDRLSECNGIQEIETTHNSFNIKDYIPCFKWHGLKNQYNGWLFGFNESKGILRGDFGISYVTKQPVITIIKDKIGWTLFFSILSIVLAYVISIPIGIKIAEFPHKPSSKFMETTLFFLYSFPSFFIGVLLLMLFANPSVLAIFPPSGIKPIGGYSDNASFLNRVGESFPYVILPIITYTYSSIAFLSKLTTASVNEQLTFDYIATAKAKGLTNHNVIWKHALKNSAIPLITVFSSVFPAVIGGSVIIESIFTIPGMGSEIIKSIIAHDYPIVIAFVTLTTFLTVISYLISDILNALIDPRIRI
jgi:peptide/nickel transport system permease protein